MTRYWTWSGTCFGYRQGDALFTYDGREVGRFHADEVYGADGVYLGEVMMSNRLITNCSKQSWRRFTFIPQRSSPYTQYADYAGYAMWAGHEDFPNPDAL